MKCVILAGGFGTRFAEETDFIPKPLIKIGDKPIILHLMESLSRFGILDFTICLGYKGDLIKKYFVNLLNLGHNIEIDFAQNNITKIDNYEYKFKIKLIDTGLNNQTGSRLKQIEKYMDKECFLFTYGDGLSNLNPFDVYEEHKKKNKLVTVTAVKPDARFGALYIDQQNLVNKFGEKQDIFDNTWVNGGFFIVNPDVFKIIENNNYNISWEVDILPKLAQIGELNSYKYEGFWKAMDTIRDQRELNSIVSEGNIPWMN